MCSAAAPSVDKNPRQRQPFFFFRTSGGCKYSLNSGAGICKKRSMDRAAQSRALRLKGEALVRCSPGCPVPSLSSRRPSLVHQWLETSRGHLLCMIRSRTSRSRPGTGRMCHGGGGFSAPSNSQATGGVMTDIYRHSPEGRVSEGLYSKREREQSSSARKTGKKKTAVDCG